MSDYNRLQLSTFVLNDQLVVRANSVEELKELSQSLAEKTDELVEAFNKFKEVYLAKGVMTGGTPKSSGSGAGAAPKSAGSPPASGGSEAPTCGCGVPMLDLAGRGFKYRWYADKQKCKNEGKERSCWGKK